jgi:hypothetical protein
MACKLPNCYPVSVDFNDMEKLFKNKNERILENFERTCPSGYILVSNVDYNLQDTHSGSGTSGQYYINPKGGGTVKSPGLVGWEAIITGDDFPQSITGIVATHTSRSDIPGGNIMPGIAGTNPDQITFRNLSQGIPELSHRTRNYYYCVKPVPPTPITNVNTSKVTTSSFTLSWSGGVNGMTYKYSLNGTPITTNIVDNGVEKSSADFSGLTPGTNYSIIVTAENINGTQSGTASIRLPAGPTALTNITVASQTTTSFIVTWSGGLNATSYTYKINGTETTPSSDDGVTAQSAAFSNLTVDTTYVLIITATNENGSTTGTSLSVKLTNPTQASRLAGAGGGGSDSDSSPGFFESIFSGISSFFQSLFSR